MSLHFRNAMENRFVFCPEKFTLIFFPPLGLYKLHMCNLRLWNLSSWKYVFSDVLPYISRHKNGAGLPLKKKKGIKCYLMDWMESQINPEFLRNRTALEAWCIFEYCIKLRVKHVLRLHSVWYCSVVRFSLKFHSRRTLIQLLWSVLYYCACKWFWI